MNVFLLEGSLSTQGHPATVEFNDPLLSYVPTQSLKEPKDLEAQPKGTILQLTMHANYSLLDENHFLQKVR